MSKLAATDRMARLIAAIPWIVAQDGVMVDEIAERFDYPRDALLADLQEVVFYVGVPPYTPDTLIEVLIEDDMVWIRYADWFARPMRLAGDEILALLAAGETALGFDRQDETGPLVRGLAKLRLSTGSGLDVVDVEAGSVSTAALPVLRAGAQAHTSVDITYHGFGTGQRSERRIEPHRLFLDRGAWYVSAHCHRAGDQRVFRVDRIEAAESSGEPFAHPTPDVAEAETFALDGGESLTIVAPADRAFVLDGVPVETFEVDGDVLRVTLSIASPRWRDQLLLRLGPDATVVEGSASVADTAHRLLQKYRS